MLLLRRSTPFEHYVLFFYSQMNEAFMLIIRWFGQRLSVFHSLFLWLIEPFSCNAFSFVFILFCGIDSWMWSSANAMDERPNRNFMRTDSIIQCRSIYQFNEFECTQSKCAHKRYECFRNDCEWTVFAWHRADVLLFFLLTMQHNFIFVLNIWILFLLQPLLRLLFCYSLSIL